MTSPEDNALQEVQSVLRKDPEFFNDLGSIDAISDLAEKYNLDYRIVADIISQSSSYFVS